METVQGDAKTSIRRETLVKIAAILLILGGLLYILVQFIHPPDDISSVGTSMWTVVALSTSTMSLFIFLGLLGTYLVQVEEVGLLGLLGVLMFGLFWLVSMIFGFVEALILPLLTAHYPEFVAGMVGLFGNVVSDVDLGLFPGLASIFGIFYIVGGILYGLAGYRGNVLSRNAFLFLIIAALATVATGIVPHPMDRVFAIPMGVSLIWIGSSLGSKRRVLRRRHP